MALRELKIKDWWRCGKSQWTRSRAMLGLVRIVRISPWQDLAF
jgi:hypothetical protein